MTEGNQNEKNQTAVGDGETAPIKEPTLIDNANAAAENLRKAASEYREVLSRAEQLHANQVLSGRATAGKEPEKKEETAVEYKNRILRGEI